MRSRIIVLSLLSLGLTCYSQDNNKELENQIHKLNESVRELKVKNSKLQRTVEVVTNDYRRQSVVIDSLQQEVQDNKQKIKAVEKRLVVDTKRNNLKTKNLENGIQQRTVLGIIALIVALVIAICIAFLLHKRLKKQSENSIDKLRKQSEELNERIISQMSVDMKELDKLSDSISNLSSQEGKDAINHDLIKVLADRITFMEITLYRMDSSVKGHKQLSKSIKQMKDNLLANGYELVDMLGKPYNDGMKVIANFVEDENLKEGEQIITGITKPQINYKGQMIQAAQITVSQN